MPGPSPKVAAPDFSSLDAGLGDRGAFYFNAAFSPLLLPRQTHYGCLLKVTDRLREDFPAPSIVSFLTVVLTASSSSFVVSYSAFVLSIELSHHLFQRAGMPTLDAFVAAAGQRTADLFCSTDKFLGQLTHKFARTLFAAQPHLDQCHTSLLQLPFFVISHRLGAPNFPSIKSTFFIGFIDMDRAIQFRQVVIL
jgi:hypothetical protein